MRLAFLQKISDNLREAFYACNFYFKWNPFGDASQLSDPNIVSLKVFQ